MTGVAWGHYADYLDGAFDGIRHRNQAQTDKNGNGIYHGRNVPYFSPDDSYGKFLCTVAKSAMDAGAIAIHLEEPEFWARAGYGATFQREWKAFYGEDWVAPHSSPDAQYRGARLQYDLYRRTLKQVFDFVRAENARTGRNVKCYVPTHSLINYSQWRIVSPESSLLDAGVNGYIAQVWTGTARTPNFYRGTKRERTFETAFLEYGATANMVEAAGAVLWFLADPVEDDPNHSWEDYRTNYESTVVASLFWPRVWRYEVMPWPDRILHGQYPTVNRARRKPGEPVQKTRIPPAYATEMMTVITTLNHMEQRDIHWDCGTQGIGVMISDTMMFQRSGPSQSDPDLGSFYGLALPLLKHGIPVEPVQLENAARARALDPYKVLFLTYEGMKPMNAAVHAALAGWVKRGGVLIFVGDDADPYNGVRAWWNDSAKGMSFKAPREHLFEQLGVGKDSAAGMHPVQNGRLIYCQDSPANLSHRQDGGSVIRELARRGCEAIGLPWRETNYLVLRRGPYLIAAGLDESTNHDPHVLRGRFIDLFDPRLPVITAVSLSAGSRRLLLVLDGAEGAGPTVLASACKVLDAKAESDGTYRFRAVAPQGTEATVRLRLPRQAMKATVNDAPLALKLEDWDASTNTLLLKFPNSAAGVRVSVQ